MRWSALKKQLMSLFDETMDVEIHLTSLANAKNKGALTHLGKLEIRAKGRLVWAFPDHFREELADHSLTLGSLMGLLHTYLELPKAELLSCRLEEDPLHLIPTLACLDRRVGKRQLRRLSGETPERILTVAEMRLA